MKGNGKVTLVNMNTEQMDDILNYKMKIEQCERKRNGCE